MKELLSHQAECRGAMAVDHVSFRDEFEVDSTAVSALQSLDFGRSSSSSDSVKGRCDNDHLYSYL
jgi:hypothetical protein